ncbi:hypothetical protein ACP70R_003228 [Stipagrostis hirtigluma subsp. patula]
MASSSSATESKEAAGDKGSGEMGSGGKESGAKSVLESLLDNLDLRDDEEEDIMLDEDVEELRAQTRWLAIAKVLTTKPSSVPAFRSSMRYAWSLARDPDIKAFGANLFVCQFFCLGDWKKVMEEGPWLFRGNAMLMSEYDGVVKPSMMELVDLPVWIQIYDLPPAFTTDKIVKQLAGRVGKVMKVDSATGGNVRGNFIRVRVSLDIRKSLVRVLNVANPREPSGRSTFLVKYEKMPRFCAVCGVIGHTSLECGDGVHDETKFQYGAGWGGRRGGGRQGTRSTYGDTSGEFEDDDRELQDDASSPIKPGAGDMEVELSKAKKRLPFEKSQVAIQGHVGGLIGKFEKHGTVDSSSGDLERVERDDDTNSRGSKRRKGEGEKSEASANALSAGSLKEFRREQ